MDRRVSLEWCSDYSVGHNLMDAQHRKLLQLCADAEALIGQVDDIDASERFHSLLNEISVYAQVHFATEEGMLKRIGYAGLTDQEASHCAYLEHMTDILLRTMRGEQDAVAVYQFLTGWWLNHILVEDMQYKPHVQLKSPKLG